MSLLEEMTEKFVIMDKHTTSDGEGGFNVTWSDGAVIDAVATRDSSMRARLAEQQGVSSVWTITTSKAVNLEFHTVLKRVRDGKILRVTTEGGENKTPNSATLNMNQVAGEEWKLS